MRSFDPYLAAGRIVPVLSYGSVAEAVTTTQMLYEAGLRLFEITLRHPSALESIPEVIGALGEDAIVGVGTVLTPELAEQAQATGAHFGVSPGLTNPLASAVIELGWPFLPGVATISEALKASQLGFTTVKFFPAEASGGTAFLKAAGSVLPTLKFCPTGGVTAQNAGDYLALKNVPVVGGSWMIKRGPSGDIDQSATISRVKDALNF
jgi:2-dehydro-3-deoxyphosphogluconate aldolase/(4S)-4-hydroxy-2-oxoglutarate aldolase